MFCKRSGVAVAAKKIAAVKLLNFIRSPAAVNLPSADRTDSQAVLMDFARRSKASSDGERFA